MSEEERKEQYQKTKTSKHHSRYFGIASFVFGLFSFMTMLFLWIIILIDMCEMVDGVSKFWENVNKILVAIIFFSFHLAFLFGVLALIIGINVYSTTTYKENRFSKKFALWGIILSLFYWAMSYIQWTRIPGYGW